MTALQLDPGTQRAYFSRPGGINDWWRPEDGPYRHHYGRELQVLKEQMRIPDGARVADLGTGQGRFARFFAREGAAVTAVDISADMLAVASQRAREDGVADRIQFVEQAIEEFLIAHHECFDIVSLMEVLDHLPDPSRVIALCEKALRPGGQLVLTFVSQASLYGALAAVALSRTRSGDLKIARPYPPADVTAWLRCSGLEYRMFGVGFLAIIARETLAAPFGQILGGLCWAEGQLKRYYRHPTLAARCVHVVCIARKASTS